MKIEIAVLNCLQDDAESIEQLLEMLEDYDIKESKESLMQKLQEMLNEKYIQVDFPREDRTTTQLNINEFEKYWFRPTQKGQDLWKNEFHD